VPASDSHLLYAVRGALRDQLQGERVFQKVLARMERAGRALADIAPAITNSCRHSSARTKILSRAKSRPNLSARRAFLPEDRIDDFASVT
jgi:hypothetical protein